MDDPKPHRFERANQLFSDALSRHPSQRLEFLRDQCGADKSLEASIVKLLGRYEKLGDFLEKPAGRDLLALPGLDPGTVLAARFRIEELVGRGGMGEVYRAHDIRLDDVVALKTVRAEWRSDPTMLARFHDEIRMARRVVSENVCPLYDLFPGSDDGAEIPFFTMKYLPGHPLSKLLAGNARMESARIAAIAADIANGLDAAHREGIIHRDLKPANIILTPIPGGERAVITDFGLAKRSDPQAGSLSESGVLVGTPDYMAPEQFVEETVTAAADIFALGVILYEMACGQRPYPHESIVRAGVRRVTGEPAHLPDAGAGLPKHWDVVLRRAMARRPSDRFRTAGELAQALRDPSSVRSLRLADLRLPRVSRRRLAILAIPAAGLAGVAGFLRYYQRALPQAPLIMLTPIESASPETARSLDVQVEKGLVQSAHVRTLPPGEIARAWTLMAQAGPPPPRLESRAAREIALRRGANFVLFGDLGRVSDEWVLKLQLEVMGRSADHAQEEFTTHLYASGDNGLLSLAAKAADWVRRTAGEPENEVRERSRPAEEVTTRSWEALKEYTAAKQAWNVRPSGQPWPPDQREAAEAHLEHALEIDPQFAIAAAELADIQVSSRQVDEGLRNYQRAARLIDQRNLTDREALLIRGRFALDTGQYAGAEQVFSRYSLQYPKEALPLFHKARAVENQGHMEAAVGLLGRALELEPGAYYLLVNRALRYVILGRMAEAESDLQQARKIGAGDWTNEAQSVMEFARFNADGVWRELEAMRRTGSVDFRSKAYLLQACFRAGQGRLPEAADLIEAGLRFDAQNSLPVAVPVAKRRALAQVLLRQGRRREAVERARSILPERAGMRAVLETGALLAQAGDVEGAQECLPAHIPRIPPARPPDELPAGAAPEVREWPTHWRRVLILWAEIALARGEAAKAFALLAQAPPGEAVQQWPDALVRASIASGERTTARQHLQRLFANPAAYWVPANVSAAGFMREAIAQAQTLAMPAAEWGRLARFLN